VVYWVYKSVTIKYKLTFSSVNMLTDGHYVCNTVAPNIKKNKKRSVMGLSCWLMSIMFVTPDKKKGQSWSCNQCLPITTKVVSLNSAHGEVYSIQHYVIKIVSYLRQVSGFLQVLRFPPPIKVTTLAPIGNFQNHFRDYFWLVYLQV